MTKFKFLAVLLALSLVFSCGINEHEVTVDNRSSYTVMVNFDEGVGEPLGSFFLSANSTKSKSMDRSESYWIRIYYGSVSWDTNNSGKDITIIIPSVGQPYVK